MQELQNCCSKIETKKFTPACFEGKPGELGSPAQAAPPGGAMSKNNGQIKAGGSVRDIVAVKIIEEVSYFDDLFGILLAVTIIYQYFETFEKERTSDLGF
ncbi:hypothetical protein M0R45_002500 [Rubus argutus]|uniref:Uncharacterized protein n=1 Tax=Rubus argutus TaxID=59490 RepID=A0AAW1VMP4_RUBAR